MVILYDARLWHGAFQGEVGELAWWGGRYGKSGSCAQKTGE